MTISRSEVTLVAALFAGVTAAAAQQPPAIQRPIQQSQQAAGQQQPAPADAPAPRRVEITSGGPGGATMGNNQTPATHTVAQGETLWALAQQYLGDPMLWPEIYRLNTTVIEDPHWIYPGEELRLTPDAAAEAPPAAPAADSTVVVQQSVTVAPAADTTRPQQQGPVAAMNGPTIFTSQGNQFRRSNTYELARQRAYRAVREGEYFSSGFLTENQPLPSGHIVSKTTGLPGRVNATAQQFWTVMVEPPPGETLQPGDLLMSFRRAGEVGTWGELIEPTGLLRVKAVAGDKWTAEVVRVYMAVVEGQELIKVQPFINNSSQRAEPVVGGLEGRIIRVRNDHTVAQIQNVVFIDKGANDGVRLGDIFQIYGVRTDADQGGTVEQDQGRIIIVNSRAATATGVIIELYGGGSGAQALVRQIRRMPS